jgi:hypothetical protein
MQRVRSSRRLIELSEAMRTSDARMHTYRLGSRATHSDLPHAAAAAAATTAAALAHTAR